ncbi:Aste57867_10299 [Aphanomyces stellatus]|uniref:Aste57867_10299 protein n=1 Tax=Aphanomyces stellatus TaxID=120398 RepID=A0A485KQI3_9STRA|nr:hypothetical protein As57867_010259 [Aphanomyces stellatus]VFT87173.1 Aste57867_10299 [Aphanomyces stellatus]
MNELEGGSHVSLAVAINDYVAGSPSSVYTPGMCGATACKAILAAALATYPSCTAGAAMNQKVNLGHFLATCTTLTTSTYPIAGTTCLAVDYADYFWATGQVTLTPNCAAALAGAGYSQATRWYTAVNAATLSSSNAITSAFYMSPDCIQLTQATAAKLANCTVSNTNNVVENLWQPI